MMQLEILMRLSIDYFKSKNQDLLIKSMSYIAYLGLIKAENQVVLKIYNLLGHIFILWKNYSKAKEFFNKLKDTSKMAKDLETMMYAYK